MKEMIDELIVYSMNNKLLDQNFLKKNIKRIIREDELDDYISRLKIKRNSYSEAFRIPELIEYNKDNNKLTVYNNEIDLFVKLYQIYDDELYESEKTLFHNLVILKMVLHEIEHINQKKIIDYNTDLESDIIRYSYNNLESSLLPADRLANYKSNNKILDILRNTGGPLHLIFESIKAMELINGYSVNMILEHNSPTLEYLDSIDKKDVLEKYDWYSTNMKELYDNILNEMALEERLKYGLPISEDEFSKVYTKCNIKNS